MAIKEKLLHIGAELKGHAPFTMLGAVAGLAMMAIFRNAGKEQAHTLFAIFHPAHVVLSAMVTSSIFLIHKKTKNFLLILLVGYFGSVGIATLSDSIIPYFGERVLGVAVPTESAQHEHHDETAVHEAKHNHEKPKIHLGFIEEWYIVNPAALLGIMIACFLPRTKFPHAFHILISTWASSSHIMMNMESKMTAALAGGILVVLFIAVWLPCCVSDIIFPLLFVKSDLKLTDTCICHNHRVHSHEHLHSHSEKCPHGPEN